MKVLVKQAIELYGTRYSVGLREIPEGHCCGRDWDYAMSGNYIELMDKPKAIEAVVEVAAEVEAVEVVETDKADAVEVVEVVAVKQDKKRK